MRWFAIAALGGGAIGCTVCLVADWLTPAIYLAGFNTAWLVVLLWIAGTEVLGPKRH